MSRNSGTKTEGRDKRGRFKPGNPGKPKGARNRATQAAARMIEKDSAAITRKAIELALAGDGQALRLCIERICPPLKDAPVSFPLPKIKSATDAAQAAAAVVEAVADGTLSPNQGAGVMGLVEGYRRTLETSEFETRLSALEETIK